MNDMDEYKWDREVDQLHELELKQRNKPMTPIEQAARDSWSEINSLAQLDPDKVIAIITRHIATLARTLEDENFKLKTLTKPLEDENKKLREALEGVGSDLAKGWTGHAYRKVEQALTKPT